MIILYKKDKTKHKLLNCVSSTKSSSSVFMERMNKNERGRGSADTKGTKMWPRSQCSPSPQTLAASGWPHTARGQRLEERSLCAFRPSGAQTHASSHPYSHIKPHMHSLTRAHAHTHTAVSSKVAPTSRFVLGQPENTAGSWRASPCPGAAVETLYDAESWRPVCSS